MKEYDVTGMSCAACSARVERAVSKVDGVESCSVSLLTNSMSISGDADDSAVIAAVKAAGYGAKAKSENTSTEAKEEETEDEVKPMRKRLIASLGFLIVLMYVSMGYTMFGWPLPGFFEENYFALSLTQLLLCAAVMVINQKFFINGIKGVIHGGANMDTLVAMGAGASFVYSVYAMFKMTVSPEPQHYIHGLYFESAAMILAFITVGKMLEAISKGRTTDALKSLMNLAPKTAVVVRGDKQVRVPVEEVRVGDKFIVRAGESIPVDGIITEGTCAVDESALTGESIPVDKKIGDRVFSATISRSGYICCEATKVGADTTLSQIIKMVRDAAVTKAPIAKAADKISAVFVPAVISIAVITVLVWIVAGADFGSALGRGIAVLVISCPCALGLATPVAIMVGSGIGAKNAILFKTAAALEVTGKAKTVVLDKTGTITEGEPKVCDIIAANDFEESELLETAYALESKSEHPLARAVVEYAENKGVRLCDTDNYKTLTGSGVEAELYGKRAVGGNLKLINEVCSVPQELIEQAETLSNEGKTPLYFARDGKFAGIIAVADMIKKDSPDAVRELKDMGIRVIMLTGDNEKTAEAIGRQAGVDEVISGVLPAQKQEVIKGLSEKGIVAMVGDGINDAPALTSADIGIAIGAGADVAIDAADVVLVKSSLKDVPAAIRIGKATLRTIHENLFWAFIYNALGIPVAAGVLIPVFNLQLSPMIAAAAMSLSSFCVVTNALRLNFVNVRKEKNKKIKGDKKMEKTMRIEGMMCAHCEARVKKALEAIDGVLSAEVSHEKNNAVVKLSKDVADSVLKEAVEKEGYTVL